MTEPHDLPLRPEVVLDPLPVHQALIAGDVVELGERVWAIHGVIPRDGEVILAEFNGREEAQAALERLVAVDEGTFGSEMDGVALGDPARLPSPSRRARPE